MKDWKEIGNIMADYKWLILLLLLVTGCTHETPINGTEDDPYTSVTLSLELPGSGVSAARSGVTRATDELAYTGELEISTIDVFAFDPQSKKCLFRVQGSDITTDENDKGKKTFTVTLKRGQYDLTILANVRNEVEALYPNSISEADGHTYGSVQKELLVSSAVKWNATYGTTGYRPIPMWGMKENVAIDENTNLQGTNAFQMTRLVARIDVNLSDEAKANFTMTSIRLYNYHEYGRLFPDGGSTIGSDGYVTAPSLPEGKNRTKGPLVYSGTDITGGKSCSGMIYTFDAPKGSRANYLTNTCLVIGGTFKGEENHFYRLDFATVASNSTTWLDILRNHIYRVAITKVEGPGYSTPDEAFNALPENIEVDIMKWDAANLSNVKFDGQYYLSLSSLEMGLSSMASTSGLTIDTNCAEWRYKLSNNSNPDAAATWTEAQKWIKVISNHNEGQSYTTTTDNIRFTVDQNTSLSERYAYLHITAGRFTMSVTIKQGLWFINGVSVSPTTREASPGGQQYTLTISGYFAQIPVRMTNLTTNVVLDGTNMNGVATGEQSTTGNYTFNIPSFWNDKEDSRQFLIEYQDLSTGEWVAVLDPMQMAYWIEFDSNDTNRDKCYGFGQYISVMVRGNYPNMPIRMAGFPLANSSDNDNNSNPDTDSYEYPTSMPARNSYDYQTYDLYVPYNSTSKRRVRVQYKTDQGWTSAEKVIITQLQGNKILADNYPELTKGNGYYTTTVPHYTKRRVAYMDYEEFKKKPEGGNEAATTNWYDAIGRAIPNPEIMGSNNAMNTNGQPHNHQVVGNSTTRYLNYDYALTATVPIGCGEYEEEGYPAGTWRAPTIYEAWEMKRLNADGKFERRIGYMFPTNSPNKNHAIWTATEILDQYTSYNEYLRPGSTYYYFANGNIHSKPGVSVVIAMLYVGGSSYKPYSGFPVSSDDENDTYLWRKSLYQSENSQKAALRCVRSESTDRVGGPGFVPTVPW